MLLLLALCFNGCTTEQPDAPTTSQGRAVATIRDKSADQRVAPEAKREVFIDIAYSHYWTFNDLHDFLENSARNTVQPFSPDDGEWLALYLADETTTVADWNTRLKQDMIVKQFSADGALLCYFTINITGAPTVSTSVVPSTVPSQPTSQPTPSQDETSAPSSTVSQAPSGNSAPSAPSSAPLPQKTKITVYGNASNQALVNAIAAFNKQSKTIEVTLWEYDTAEFYTANALEQALETQKAPNLLLMDLTQMNIAARRGLLLDLAYTGVDQYAASLHPTAWKATATGTHRYGVPVGCITSAIACNDELIYRADASIPTDFASLVSNAATVLKWIPGTPPLEIITDTADSKDMAEQFMMMLWSYGDDFLNADGTAAAFNTAAGLSVLSVYTDLKSQNLIGDAYNAREFWLGNTAYGLVNTTEYSELFGRYARGNYTSAPLAMPGEQAAISPLNVYCYCIPATEQAEQAEAAYEFLQYYFHSPNVALEECKRHDWLPATLQGLKDSYYTAADWQPFIAALDTAKPMLTLSYADTLYDYIADAIHSVLTGKATPQQALTKAEEKINIRLNR